MDILYSILLAIAAFWLGACPFAVWLGRWRLRKEITHYGDGNPGSANVFRAGGGVRLGLTAVLLDIAKGVPFVLISHLVFDLPITSVIVIGFSAILGHAFSPILRFRGGKAVAVTFGVLMAFPQPDILFAYTILTVLGFLFIEQHSWVAISGPVGTSIYVIFSRGISWELLFMLCVLALFFAKQHNELNAMPVFKANIVGWLQSRRRET
ncbi:MAG TPA: glycerol-3-phosphate acyltransferase [Dehalococcoidia bacterium]|nr:glycerol-3-phosphate acyltransferase [Dehalococcoidia bacterium]